MQLFYNNAIDQNTIQFSFSKEESRHISKVLRKKEGDVFDVTFNFPEEYGVKELAGIKARLDIAIIKVWKKTKVDSVVSDLAKKCEDEKAKKEAVPPAENKTPEETSKKEE